MPVQRGHMQHYRLYCLDGIGSISLAESIDASDDSDAIIGPSSSITAPTTVSKSVPGIDRSNLTIQISFRSAVAAQSRVMKVPGQNWSPAASQVSKLRGGSASANWSRVLVSLSQCAS